jgi:hypothetical protein
LQEEYLMTWKGAECTGSSMHFHTEQAAEPKTTRAVHAHTHPSRFGAGSVFPSRISASPSGEEPGSGLRGLPPCDERRRHACDPPSLPPSSPPPTGILADLFVFDPSMLTWTELTGAVHGTPPSARVGHGFTSAGGRLYVHGGLAGNGECRMHHCKRPYPSGFDFRRSRSGPGFGVEAPPHWLMVSHCLP